MKRFLFILALFAALSASAQSQTELTPQQRLEKAQREVAAAKKAIKEAKKAAKSNKKKEEKIKKQAAEQAQLEAKAMEAEAEAARLKAAAAVAQQQARQSVESENLQSAPKADEQPRAASTGGWTTPEKLSTKTVEETTSQSAPLTPETPINLEIPEIDGRVVFTLDLDLPGLSADEIYGKVYKYLQQQATDNNQRPDEVTGIQLVNEQQHQIAARYQEWMLFSRTALSLDRSKFNYVILADCTDNHLHLTMERISFGYEEHLDYGFRATAEELISDRKALNKKGQVYRNLRKFRQGTIDRKNEIFNALTDLLTK